MRIPIITQYLSVLSVHDETGHILDMRDRYCATLIFPLKGRIRFSAGERVTLADGAHPIYLSRGACYRNECLEEAHSIMFNFQDDIAPGTIESLPPAPAGAVAEAYWSIQKAQGDACALALILSCLYRLLHQVLSNASRESGDLLAPALEMMRCRFCESGLTLDDLASAAHISKVYLGKCFVARYGQSPMRYLREIRMRHAADYLRERRPVGEVARLVGYADIFQFSRAFKQHFGAPPSRFCAD